jgi:hypothetical protein
MPKKTPGAVAEVPLEAARALWWERQGLGGAVSSPGEIVRRSGWVNTAGSSGPYLSWRARGAKVGKRAADAAALGKRDLVELFTVRGCTMLVPAEDVPLALAAARQTHAEKTKKIIAGERLAAAERMALEKAILAALAKGGKDAAELRAAIPKDLVRPFGDAGRRLGESSSLLFTVRDLQVRGLVRRVERGGRIDGDDFEFRIVGKGEAGSAPFEGDRAALLAELARRFLAWAGPASLRELAHWADIPQKEAEPAALAAGAERVLVPEAGEMWVLGREVAALERASAGSARGVRFLPFRDNWVSLRRGMGALVDPKAAREPVLDWMNKPALLADVESLHAHAIAADGRLIGIWDFDPNAKEIAWATFAAPPPPLAKAIRAAAEETQDFIAKELGDLLFYAVDNERNRAGRLEGVARLRAKFA